MKRNTVKKWTEVSLAKAWRDYIKKKFSKDPDWYKDILASAEQKLAEAIVASSQRIIVAMLDDELPLKAA